MSKLKRNELEYFNLLYSFRNYAHCLKICESILSVSIFDERREKIKLIKDEISSKKRENDDIGGVVVIENNESDTYPVVIYASIGYDKNKTMKMNGNMELLFRRASVAVENWFANNSINVDINPRYIIWDDMENLQEDAELRISSLEIPLALALFGLVTKQNPKMKIFSTGSVDNRGIFFQPDMLDEKCFAFDMEDAKRDLILPAGTLCKSKRIKEAKNFDSAVRKLYEIKELKIDERFIGDFEHLMSIAEMYFLRYEKDVYLPIYENMEILLKKSHKAKEMNMLFVSLMRQASNYNHAGELQESAALFSRAKNLKDKLVKEKLLELNSITLEFNNVYAVLLKDIYRNEEGMELLKKNIKEKKHSGKHLLISTYGTLAQYYIQSGNYSKAEKLLSDNLDFVKIHIETDLSRTYCNLAKLETLRGEYELAEDYIKNADADNNFRAQFIHKIFITMEKIRLYAYWQNPALCEENINELKKLTKKTHFTYMIPLAEELLGYSLLATEAKRGMVMLNETAEKLLNQQREDFSLFGMRILANLYEKTQKEEYFEELRRRISRLNFFREPFRIYIDEFTKNKKSSLLEFARKVNIL